MRAITKAATLGMPFENKFSINPWKKTKVDHPRLILPEKAINSLTAIRF
jgi:hypothetical protein